MMGRPHAEFLPEAARRVLPRWWRTLRAALPAIVLYYAVQAVGVLILVAMSARYGYSLADLVGNWDADWFAEIAKFGYQRPIMPHPEAGGAPQTLVFFPLYPALTAAVMTVGLPPLKSALLITVLAGGVVAWGLFTLGRELAGPRTGTLLAGLVALAPGALVLHMGYSEALFLAFAVWTLVALRREQWLLAGALTALAGLTRNTAGALIVAVLIAAVLAMVRGRGGWRVWLGTALAPTGLLAYLGYVASRTGRLDGWFWLENRSSDWVMRFDWGAFTWHRLVLGLTGGGTLLDVLVALIVLAALATLCWSYTCRLPPSWHVYTTLVVVTALAGSNFWQSRPRFLLLAVALAIPPALLLANRSRSVAAAALVVGTLACGWFGAYLVTAVHTNP